MKKLDAAGMRAYADGGDPVEFETGEDLGDVNEGPQQADGSKQPDTCGLDLGSHIKTILVALLGSGSGLGCRDTISALQEVAEAARQKNNFPVYTPSQSKLVDAALGEIAVEMRAAFEEFRKRQDADQLEYLKGMDPKGRMVRH